MSAVFESARAQVDEEQRLAAVRRLRLVDSVPEERFDKVVRMAQALFGVSMVEINLIDQDRQFTKAAYPAVNAGKNTPREQSFCTRTVTEARTLLVPDATQDSRFSTNPLVTGGPNIRFYAGHPLTSQGQRVGSLCLVDDEPRTLSDVQVQMLADLATWVEHELERDAEMAHAAEVQRSLLPRTAPELDGYDIAGTCVAARNVGGDFYGWRLTGENLHLVLVDVMGKGVGPALVAAGLRSALRASHTGADLAGDFNRAATSVEQDLADTASFATAFAAQIVASTGALSYVDAGHGLGLIVGADGAWRRMPADGLPLGILSGDQWDAHPEHLAAGETLVILSDGILDVFDDVHEAAERVADLLTRCATLDAALAALTEQVEQARVVGQDDVTVVAVHRR